MSAAAVLLCTAAGCAHSGSTPAKAAAAAAPTASAAPVVTAGTPQELLAALRKSPEQKNYAFTVTLPDLTAKGSVVPGAADVTVVSKYDDETDSAEVRVIDGTRYMRLGVQSKDIDLAKSSSDATIRAAAKLFNGKTWFTIDPKRLKSVLLALNLNDVTGLGQFLKNAHADLGTTAQMSGTVNLATMHGQHGMVDYDVLKQAGSLQTFIASLDAQNRLAEFTQDSTRPNWDFKFTGYDAQQPPAAPAGAKPLPAPMYDWIND
jgi:hypothetical protein